MKQKPTICVKCKHCGFMGLSCNAQWGVNDEVFSWYSGKWWKPRNIIQPSPSEINSGSCKKFEPRKERPNG